jgi:hypothetical protein
VGDRPGSPQGAVSFCSPTSRSTSLGPISTHFLIGGLLERASQPRSAASAGKYRGRRTHMKKQKQADCCGISLQSGRAGFWIFMGLWLSAPSSAWAGLWMFMWLLLSAFKLLCKLPDFSWDPGLEPPEAPGPVCEFLCDTRLQPPECLGRLSDFHGILAFSLRAKVPGQAPILVVRNVGVRP